MGNLQEPIDTKVTPPNSQSQASKHIPNKQSTTTNRQLTRRSNILKCIPGISRNINFASCKSYTPFIAINNIFLKLQQSITPLQLSFLPSPMSFMSWNTSRHVLWMNRYQCTSSHTFCKHRCHCLYHSQGCSLKTLPERMTRMGCHHEYWRVGLVAHQ